MINTREFDKLCDLAGDLVKATSAVHTAAPEDRIEAAYNFVRSDEALYEFLLSITEQEPKA